jgi:Mg-chelatase subunit ChlD
MKRRNRNLVLFNLSALDVLAMAAGIFVLLAVMLMPYYRKTMDAHAELAEVRASVETLTAEIEGTRRAAAADLEAASETAASAAALESEAGQSRAAAVTLGRQARDARARAEQDDTAVSNMEEVFDKRIINAMDIVFVIDTTASMRPVIKDLALSIGGIARVLERLVPSLRVGVVAYRDYDTGGPWVTRPFPPTPTASGMARIQSFVEGLRTRSSNTPREAVLSGLSEALSLPLRSGAKKSIILIGDAAPHRKEEQATLQLARRWSAGGPERSVSALFIDTPSYRRFGSGDRGFFAELARSGGGQFNRHSGEMIESVLLSVLDTR